MPAWTHSFYTIRGHNQWKKGCASKQKKQHIDWFHLHRRSRASISQQLSLVCRHDKMEASRKVFAFYVSYLAYAQTVSLINDDFCLTIMDVPTGNHSSGKHGIFFQLTCTILSLLTESVMPTDFFVFSREVTACRRTRNKKTRARQSVRAVNICRSLHQQEDNELSLRGQ